MLGIPFPDLRRRRREPEVMDHPGLDEARHRGALRGLGRINRVSGTAGSLWPHVRDLARRLRPPRPLRLLDVACGGGDVALGLWRRAERAGVPVEVAGCDLSPAALRFAREWAAAAGASASFFPLDVCRDPLPAGYDVLTCSLFLHHLGEEEAVALLRGMRESGAALVLVSDLRRGRLGYVLAWLGARLLSRSDVVHTDATLSVRAAFTPAEARELAGRAGLSGATLRPAWPQRFLLKWERPG
ncbi:MAG TPA: methyltransferase domain-containing protein [Gemmataceae bacterium]